jgi:hypothetical protein
LSATPGVLIESSWERGQRGSAWFSVVQRGSAWFSVVPSSPLSETAIPVRRQAEDARGTTSHGEQSRITHIRFRVLQKHLTRLLALLFGRRGHGAVRCGAVRGPWFSRVVKEVWCQ